MEFDLNRLTKEQVAILLGVGVRSIDIYIKQKEDPLTWHPTGAIKYYVWSEVLAWKCRREAKKVPAKVFQKKDDLVQAKLEGQNLLNERTSLENQVRKGQLLEASDVKQTWSNTLVDIKQALRNAGHIAATDITDGMGYAKKKAIIDSLIFDNLTTVIEKVDEQKVETSSDVAS